MTTLIRGLPRMWGWVGLTTEFYDRNSLFDHKATWFGILPNWKVLHITNLSLLGSNILSVTDSHLSDSLHNFTIWMNWFFFYQVQKQSCGQALGFVNSTIHQFIGNINPQTKFYLISTKNTFSRRIIQQFVPTKSQTFPAYCCHSQNLPDADKQMKYVAYLHM